MKVLEVNRLSDETMEFAPAILSQIMIARVQDETPLALPDPVAVATPEVVSVLIEDLHLALQLAGGVSFSDHSENVVLLSGGQM